MMQSIKRLLITGGAGFIGSNLISLIRASNIDIAIRVIDNESLGKFSVLTPFDVEQVNADMLNSATLEQALEDVDAVVHLAADTRVIESIEDPDKNFQNNVVATFQLLQAMRKMGVKQLVCASTGGAILGEAPSPVHEEMVPKPLSPYGASKLAQEGYCSAFSHLYDMKIANLRFSNVYGPLSFHKGSVVATFCRALLNNEPISIYGDGSQTRDYVFTEDLCQGIVNAIEREVSGVYQLGTGIPTSLNQLVDTLSSVTKRTITPSYLPSRNGEILHTYCDITKAKREIAYSPAVSLEAGLTATWQWFIAQNN